MGVGFSGGHLGNCQIILIPPNGYCFMNYFYILRASVCPCPLEIGKWALDFIAGTLDSSSMINFCEFNDTATWETRMTSCVELNSILASRLSREDGEWVDGRLLHEQTGTLHQLVSFGKSLFGSNNWR